MTAAVASPPRSTRPAVWVQGSPLGPLAVVTTASGVRTIHLRGPLVVAGSAPPGGADGGVAGALDAYFAGELDALAALTVDLSGLSAFSAAVLTALRAVPAGWVTSYGRLAAEAGRPGAARAVGRAMGANPIPLVVPCHRVVAGDGSLGGFSCGLDVKRWLLAHEGHAQAAGAGAGVGGGSFRRRLLPHPS